MFRGLAGSDLRTFANDSACMSMWFDAHSGQLSVIVTMTELFAALALHRPCMWTRWARSAV